MDQKTLQEIEDKLSNNIPVHFDGSSPANERRLPAELIAQALRNGNSVEISHAVLDGPFSLQYAIVRGEFRLTSCQIVEIADFLSATFERAVHLKSCEFLSGVDMDSTCFRADAEFDKSSFESPPITAPGDGANIFHDAEFHGVLSFERARFKGPRPTSFQRAYFGSLAAFAEADFRGELNFADAHVRGDLVLNQSRVSGPCVLGGMRVDCAIRARDAYFGRHSLLILAETTATSKVDLRGARVLGGLIATRVNFGSVEAGDAIFARIVRFTDSAIVGTADFSGARFLSHTRQGKFFVVDFRRISVGGQLKINDAEFRGILRLDDAKIGRDLVASNATFKRWTTFRRLTADAVDFSSSRFVSRDEKDKPTLSQLKVTGEFFASNSRFQTGASLNDCTIGKLTLTGTRSFGTLNLAMTLVSSTFNCGYIHARAKDVALNLEGLRVGQIAWFDKAWLAGSVSAIGLQVMHQLSWNEVITTGTADFYELDARRGAFFRGAIFGDSCRFMSATIAGELHFSAAQFRGTLDIQKTRASTIYFCKLPNAPYQKAATIDRGFWLQQSQFDYANFSGVEFCKTGNRKPARRAGPKPETPAVCCDHCDFLGVANFTEVAFRATTRFYGTTFSGEALFQRSVFDTEGPANFENVSFKGRAVFFRVRFQGGASFNNCRFDNLAIFRARFQKQATFENSRFAGAAEFSDPETRNWTDEDNLWTDKNASLIGSIFSDVSFFQARFLGDARFESVKFKGELSLREAAFATLYLPAHDDSDEECKLLPGKIELGGCKYDHVELKHPCNLLMADKKTLRLKRGYDRQSFAQLESSLRRTGNDDEGDRVYLAGRRAERRQKSAIGQVADWIYGCLVNYGVRPWRLAALALAFVCFGTWFFSHSGTVYLKDSRLRGSIPYDVTWQEAASFGFAHFLPVSLPIKDYLVPASHVVILPIWRLGNGSVWVFQVRPTSIAMIMQLAGWILVPIGVAAMTGVLMRKSR